MEQIAGRRPIGIGKGASLRVWACVCVSLCLHAGFLLAWRSAVPDFRGQAAAVLSLDLVLIERPARAPAKIPAREQQQGRGPAPAQRPSVRQTPPERHAVVQKQAQPSAEPITSPAETAPEPKNVAAAPATETNAPIKEDHGSANRTTPRRASTQALVKASLLTDLTRHFEYPALARRRGWQGTVLLSVSVKSDGVLERVHVSASSGYAILDRSAIDTMRRIGYIAQAESWLNGQGVELLLPVVYRLTD